jgi:flagellar motor switch protein FliN/FliY
MELTDNFDLDAMLDGGSETTAPATAAAPQPTLRDKLPMLRKIPVTLTLEVGSASVSLAELIAIEPGSVVELDRLAGEPLLIKVNGTPGGRAEVVVAGENYGLKVVELEHLDLDSLTS